MTGLAHGEAKLPMLRPAVAALLVALALVATGCGDDDEDERTGAGEVTRQTEATAPETAPLPADTTAAEPERTGATESGGATAPSPEDQAGGAGDEVPASSQALITGRGGRLRPAVVHVPPFIAIRVQLRSADGVEYELRGGGRRVRAGGEIESASTTFDGLRPGRRLVLSGPQGRVSIEANAEPGP